MRHTGPREHEGVGRVSLFCSGPERECLNWSLRGDWYLRDGGAHSGQWKHEQWGEPLAAVTCWEPVSRGTPKAWGGSDDEGKADGAGWMVTSDQHCTGAHSKDTGLQPVSIPVPSESLY